MSMHQQPVVILAAITGGTQKDREGAKVPTTPEEIADEAYRCWQAGAAVVHIHARDEQKQPTGDLAIFSDIIRRIRAKCDILIQTTNGIGSRRDAAGKLMRPTEAERMALLTVQPKQDLFSIAGGSWDFYHPGVPDKNIFSFMNSEDFLRRTIPAVMATGGALEFEIVEPSHLEKLRRLADEGVFDAATSRYWLDYCFGFGGMPCSTRAFAYALDEGRRVFPQARWEVTGTDRGQFPMTTLGVLNGADIVRVGFEDNIYLPNGRPARTNADLVEAMARIASEHGREPATVEEARRVFRL
jgi:3-keto-5-aminohexanoate cleavage enzyme